MASDRFEFLQHLRSYTEVIDGSVEPDRIPYSAAAYPVMAMHRSILENITRLKQATEDGSNEEQGVGIMVIGGAAEIESESSDLHARICAELSKQDTLEDHDLETMAQIFVRSDEKSLDEQKQKVEVHRESLAQSDRDEFDYEVQKMKSVVNYSQTNYLSFSREMPEHFLAFARHVCR